jgi:hypothetical protein
VTRLSSRNKRKPGRRQATKPVSRGQKEQEPLTYRIGLTPAAKGKQIPEWKALKKLDVVTYEKKDYRPGDIAYICTGTDFSLAKIMEIRETGDHRGRKEIFITWLYNMADFSKREGDNWTAMRESGANYVESNAYQILPWDTLSGKVGRKVRTYHKYKLDIVKKKKKKFELLLWNDSAVRLVYEDGGS